MTLAIELRDDGFALEHVDLGGGLGIAYEGRPMITPAEYAAAVLPELRRAGIPVVLEPGRAIVGHSGALVAQVVDTKQYPDGRQFAVLDAGMTELMRPALYGSFHRILPVTPRPGAGAAARHRRTDLREQRRVCARAELPPVCVDDLVAILDTGAYGAVMASNYNRRMLARKCWSTMASGGDPPPANAGRCPGPRAMTSGGPLWPTVTSMKGLLIAFEGLDQSGKQTQAELLRDRLVEHGPTRAAAVVPRLQHADR